jgi:uncharacterized membrane protein YfcA
VSATGVIAVEGVPVLRWVALVVAGVGAGLTGSVAGLASLVSYPALLAVGLPAVEANVTNTVALVASTVGSVGGSRRELAGRVRPALRLAAAGLVGGGIGSALLLVTPPGVFERIVPFLVALGAVGMLVRGRLHDRGDGDAAGAPAGWTVVAAVGGIGVYSGYFGAGAGVMLLALLLHVTGARLPVANALKNVLLGVANSTAACAFAVFGPVRWTTALPLALGLVVGGATGPVVVRRVPADRLRRAIGLAGLGLALALAVDVYR